MKLNKISLADKKIFKKYFSRARHELSVYSFANIYPWKGLYDIRWAVIQNSLCVFFRDKLGCFLYLSPLAKNLNPETVEAAFKVMDTYNTNQAVSRIENAEAKDLSFYKSLGYECIAKSLDYLCLRKDLAGLNGNKFKAKRWSVNYFTRHYDFVYQPFSRRYLDGCLQLYDLWAGQRSQKNPDPLYQGMLKDSRSVLKVLLRNYQKLDCLGRIVKINGQVEAFSFGFPLSLRTFCIFYEVTDLAVKGLAQFIFREFCAELKGYCYINTMDDSGLENLKKVKLSYQPVRLAPAYIIQRKNA